MDNDGGTIGQLALVHFETGQRHKGGSVMGSGD
jgi:hypothetical protein